MEIRSIRFDKIKVDENQIRKEYDDENNLSGSILKNGLLEPLIVYKEGSMFRLLDGERRYRAIKAIIENDKSFPKEIDCIVSKKPSNKIVIQIITAIHKKKLSSLEEANAYKRLIEEYNLSIEEASRLTGINRNIIINKLKLLNYDKDIQDDIREGRLNPNLASQIDLNKIKNNKGLYIRVKNLGSNIEKAKELIASSNNNTSRLMLVLQRRFKVIYEELQRINETITRIENTGINLKDIQTICTSIEDSLSKVKIDASYFKEKVLV